MVSSSQAMSPAFLIGFCNGWNQFKIDSDLSARSNAAAKRLKQSARSVACSVCSFNGISTVNLISFANDTSAVAVENAVVAEGLGNKFGAGGGRSRFIFALSLALCSAGDNNDAMVSGGVKVRRERSRAVGIVRSIAVVILVVAARVYYLRAAKL